MKYFRVKIERPKSKGISVPFEIEIKKFMLCKRLMIIDLIYMQRVKLLDAFRTICCRCRHTFIA